MGVLLLALSGQVVGALVCGVLLDSAYGVPLGTLHFVYLPFTLLAFAGTAVHYYLFAYVRKSSRSTL